MSEPPTAAPTGAADSARAGPGSASPNPGRPYLYGVQGLRTVAALMVAVYHIWFHRVSGGVDVFFVVAGYFAAGSLLRIAERPTIAGMWAGVGEYWLRTARRVIPSAAVVVTATVVAGMAFMPGSQQRSAYQHAAASLAFVENWYLIAVESDYLKEELFVSPFQQFWALSIQVQSYLLFPLVALGAVWLAGRLGASRRRMLLYASGAVLAASLAFSTYLTAVNQPAAYFHLGARFWEFLAGVVLALALQRWPGNPRTLRVLGWAGLAAILSFAAVVDPSRLLPGLVALVPVTAAAAVIAASTHGVEPAPLRWTPLLRLADSSFAFYLWHWPLFVFYRLRFGQTVSIGGGLAILALSAVLAVATTRLAEQPVRASRRLRRSALATAVASALMIAAAVCATTAWRMQNRIDAQADWQDVHAALDAGRGPATGFVPSTLIAWRDLSDAYERGCVKNPTANGVKTCRWGKKALPRTVAVVGASHDAQWIEPIAATAKQLDANVVSMLKSRCPFGDATLATDKLPANCADWNREVLQRLLGDPPDLIVTMATRAGLFGEDVIWWQRPYLERLTAAGIPVLGIRDNPRFPFHVPLCVDLDGPDACAVPRGEVLAPSGSLDVAQLPGYRYLDLGDEYCPADTCPAVMDGVLVYRDSSHLTGTWVHLHAGRVQDAVRQMLGGG